MKVLTPVASLLLGAAILLTGHGLQTLLLPVRAGLEGFTPVEIGLVGSSYFAGFAAGCFHGPRLVGQVGHIRCFAAMTSVAAAVALLHAFFVFPPCWWALRFVSGACLAILSLIIESWLNESSTQETRGTVLSAYMILNLTVVTLGQLLLPLQAPSGFGLFALVSVLVSLAAVPVALTKAPAPEPVPEVRVRARKLYRNSPAGAGACFAVGLANGPFWAFGPQFAKDNGLDSTGVAVFMSVAVVGGALGQLPFGRFSDRTDRRRVILLAAACAAAAGVFLTLRPAGSPALFYLAVGLWGASALPIYSLGVAHANDHAAPNEFVETSSGLLLVYAAGAVAAPPLAAGMLSMAGSETLFLFPAAVHLALFVFVLQRMARSDSVAPEERIAFSDALQAATTVSPVFDEAVQDEMEAAAEAEVAAEADQA